MIFKNEVISMKQYVKNIIYFLPAVVSFLLYVILVCASGFGSLKPWVWVFVALLFTSAILMQHKKWWGCCGGIITGAVVIYMSTQYTGQTIDEMPIGISICIYYIVCGILCFKSTNQRDTDKYME